MAQVLGVGVIGMGWMGEVHSRSYRSIPDRFAASGLIPKLVICADGVEERARSAKFESLRLSRSRVMTQLAAATNPAHRTMLERALKSINDEMAE